MEKGNAAVTDHPAGAGDSASSGTGTGTGPAVSGGQSGGGGGTAARRKRRCPHCGYDGVGEDGVCEACGSKSDVSGASVPTTTDLGRVPLIDNSVCPTCGSEQPMNPCRVCGEFTGPRRPNPDGARVTRTDPDGTVTDFFRSGDSHVAQTRNPDGSITERVTDSSGNATTVTHVPPSAR